MQLQQEMQERVTVFAVLAVAFVITLLGSWLTRKSPTEVLIEAREYCSNVHTHRWPDYRHVYAEQCWPDGSVNQAYINGELP